MRLAFALCALIAATAALAQPVKLYVAPNGNDGWSGSMPAPNEAGTDGPLATIFEARDRLRAMPARNEPVSVLIRGGRYELSEPFVLTPLDSGSEEAPITYAAYPGERPVLSGGTQITGWQQGEGGVWQAQVPGVAESRWYPKQLFVDGKRRTRARTPNEGYFYTAGTVLPPGASTPSNTAFRFAPGDIEPWDGLEDVNVVVFHSWDVSRLFVKSIDAERSEVTFTGPAAWHFENWGPKQRYFAENSPEFLDQPGEWYLDRETGVLSTIALPGEDMAQAQVIAPRLTTLVALRGEPDLGLPVCNVTFSGISFEHQDWTIDPKGHSDAQACFTVPAAIMADGASRCVFEGCELAHVGGYGIWLRRGCRDNVIRRCIVRDLGAGAVRIGEVVNSPDDAGESARNILDNCHLYDGGHVYASGVGIWVAQSSRNVISHNEVHDFNYSGMSIGWNWNDAPNRTRDNTIEFNHVHHVMKGMLNDGGAIYTLGTSPGSVIRNNVFHDVWPYSAIGWGIYLDATTNGYLVENNVVYNTLSGGLMKHNGGHANIIQNNVFAFSAQQMLWPCWPGVEPNDFRRNIIYLTQGDLFIPMAESRLRERLTRKEPIGEWDYNCYWNPNDPDIRFFSHRWAKWREMGLDTHSIIADPKFVDADAYDFRLLEDSPALALGIKSIDTSTVGLYGEPEWVARAQLVQHPATKLPEPPPPPRPLTVADGFEDTPVGARPANSFVSGEQGDASIRVTDEKAAEGARSLRITDRPGLSNAWEPHFFYQPRYTDGTARLSFAVYLGGQGSLLVELRDRSGYPACIGPSISFEADGTLLAGKRRLTTLPLASWVRVELVCPLGEGAARSYSLSVTPPGRDTQQWTDLPFVGDEFEQLHWLGFVTSLATEATWYVDNVSIAHEEE